MKNNFKKIALFRSFYGIEGFEIPTLFKDRIKKENSIEIWIPGFPLWKAGSCFIMKYMRSVEVEK